MGFSVMLGGAEKLVPAEFWCPYGTDMFVKSDLADNFAGTDILFCLLSVWNLLK